ncbi:hypothetical protein GCK72_006829 [Caenorhabditis remanei]|uniref:C2H2-type domain-containing protein n=1 Tax=Caenorhabditis remanei TaxID=31234 RepID=A0A6A5HIC4_CAERE|nr:hypothetical protein GCK72_006829 [Caenorhabditis remanei]KAF1766871.1 hypothetical protein GCK72_006829 [Caenorhabditis remanei]
MSSNQPVDVFDFQQNPIFYEIQPSIELFAEESYQKNENIPSSSNGPVVRYIDPRMIYKCNVCHKTFTEFKGLKQHAVVHTGDRPFKCNICLKHFRFKSNLFEHQSIHTDVTPYQCSYCGKACRLKGNLKKHLRVHVTSKEELEAAYKPFSAKKSTKKYKAEQRRYWAEDCPTIFQENERNDQQFTDFTELNRELEKSIERAKTSENDAASFKRSIEMENNYIESSIIHNPAVRTWSDLMEIAKFIFFEE